LESYWAKDGERIPNTSALTYEVNAASLQDAGSYTFHVSDATDSIQSSPIMIAVNQPPVIMTQPESRSYSDGQRIMLQWIAEGAGTLSYELLQDGSVAESNNNGSFWVTPSKDKSVTQYAVKVTNEFGSVSSVTVALSLQQTSPQIIEQPRNIKLVQGEPLEIGLQASGGALSYQWYKGVSQISGATGPVYLSDETEETDSGDYFVVISNDKGIVTSRPINVSFGARLSVALDGANLTFAVDPGTSSGNWKLQRSSNLLFWEDVQTLNAQDLERLEMPVGDGSVFYRVVE